MSEVKLVPARMLLDKDTIGAINFHCGDGNVCGEYCDGILWVGTVTDDEGREVYGLHLQTAEYPEEGSSTLFEFDEPASDFDAQRLRADTAEAELPANRDEFTRQLQDLKRERQKAWDARDAAEQRNDQLQKQLDSIDNHLRGNVNDPDPLPPIMPGAASYTTTYGLVAGLRRERDYLKKSAAPLPAGDDYLRQLAQRLREYVGNPHHIDPLSEAFKRLISDSAFALAKLATLNPKPEAESHANNI